MPQSGQIIPEHLHPHVKTLINDNTVYQEPVLTPEEPIRGLYVFTSGKGRDGVVLEHSTTTAWKEEFGEPNFKLYGQPGLMPYQSLATGVVQAYSLRVMPEDAAYANLVIVAKVKVDKLTKPGTPSMVVRFEAQYTPEVVSTEEIAPLAELMGDPEPDREGFVTYPLFSVNALGRGQYGNNFRIRLISSTLNDKTNDYKNYRFEVYELENGEMKVKDIPFAGTFIPDSLDNSSTAKSLYLEDIVNDPDNGSTKIAITIFDANWEDIFEMYKADIDPDTALTVENFDLFTGVNRLTNEAIKGITYDTEHAEYASLDNPAGLPLSGGDDGTFTFTPNDPEKLSKREEAINAEYIKAFNGEIDRAVLSKRRTPSEFILDANYDSEVKKALISAITTRGDAYGFVDAGIINTAEEAITWGDEMLGLGDRMYSKEIHHYQTRDPFTGKRIPVTITYLYATLLPLHLKNVGRHIPFTGEDYTTLVGDIRGTLKPAIDADDSDTKEALYTRRLNYYQAVDSRTNVRGTQGTSQNVWSDLSEESNMHVLLHLKRKIENMVVGLAYDFADAEERARFKEDAKRMIEPYTGTEVASAEVDFQMNPWEQERSILHCYLAVVFRTINKRAIIEIDVNKRV